MMVYFFVSSKSTINFMPLTDVVVRTAKPQGKPYKMTDGEGMYLYIVPSGGKYWRFQYRYAGKQKMLALGVYPDVSLADARENRTNARKLLAAGSDPAETKKETKRLKILNSENTFEAIALEWHEVRKHEWVPSHAESVLVRLKRHVFKKLGKRPIADIDAPELLSVFKVRKPVMAIFLRIHASGILASCKAVLMP